MRWKALAEIYRVHSFAPFSNLNFLFIKLLFILFSKERTETRRRKNRKKRKQERKRTEKREKKQKNLQGKNRKKKKRKKENSTFGKKSGNGPLLFPNKRKLIFLKTAI